MIIGEANLSSSYSRAVYFLVPESKISSPASLKVKFFYVLLKAKYAKSAYLINIRINLSNQRMWKDKEQGEI